MRFARMHKIQIAAAKLNVRLIASAIWIDLRGFYSHGLAIAQGRDATK